MVSAAETNQISSTTLVLALSCWSWIVAYDTAYALCDRKDDLVLGINSSAITFGQYVVVFFLLLHLFSILLLILVAISLNFHFIFYYFVSISVLLIFYQTHLIKDFDSNLCLKAFKNNNWLGLCIFIGSVLGVSL